MRRLAFTFAALALAACGLSVTGIATTSEEDVVTPPEAGQAEDAPSQSVDAESGTETPDASLDGAGADADADAAVDAAVDADAAAAVDAGFDAGPAFDAGTGCTLLLRETFDAQPSADWRPVGNGANPPGWTADRYVLTTKGEDQVARALWYAQPLTFTGSLRAQVDFVVDPGTPSGTGLSVVWGDAADFRVGDVALSMGICAKNIVSVAAQYRFSGRVDSVTATDMSCDTTGGEPAAQVNTGTLSLELTATTVTGRINTTSDNARTATFEKTGYFGVTASTGTVAQSGIAITEIRVVSCGP